MSQGTAEIGRVFAQVVAAGITLDVAEPSALEQTLRDCARSSAFIESVRLRTIALLDEHVTIDTNQTIVTTSHGSKRQAQTAQKRANAVARMPALADALASGSIAADHVDAVAQTLSRMEPADREKLAAEAAWITATAARTTPEQLTKTLRRRARELSTNDHVSYWRNGGRTDIRNLLPLCSRHHHLAHEGSWQLTLDPESRALTVIKPGGTRQIHPPPLARAG